MDSSISNIMVDSEENDVLCNKYEKLLTCIPKTKNDIEFKNPQYISLQQLSFVSSLTNTKEWTKSLLHTSTLISKEAFVRSLNSMEAFYQKQHKKSADSQTKSLFPIKNQYEDKFDYTFKLQNGLKKVRFRLNSDYQV